jgi:hypothetical protein
MGIASLHPSYSFPGLRKIEFVEPDQADLRCPVPFEKDFCFSEMQIRLYDLPSRPTRGALRNVINAGRGAVDASGAFDEGA